MSSAVKIGLVGDYDAAITAHRAIPLALELCSQALDAELRYDWIGTQEIQSESSLFNFDGLWCVPGSPYRNTEGALLAIRYARVNDVAFLGTCGGFQHAILEYARNELGWTDADHAEVAPDSERAVISPLSCSLVEETGVVRFEKQSKIANAYDAASASEGYHCRYGLNPEFEAELISGSLRATARDQNGEVRAVELVTHPFFVATLFQPERAAFEARTPPLVKAFVCAAME